MKLTKIMLVYVLRVARALPLCHCHVMSYCILWAAAIRILDGGLAASFFRPAAISAAQECQQLADKIRMHNTIKSMYVYKCRSH